MALVDRKIPIIETTESVVGNDIPSVEGDPNHPNASLLCKNYNDLIDNELTAITDSIPVTTTDLTEGTNLYYTDARFDTRLETKTTDDLTEGATNKYFADSLARQVISVTGNGSYDNTTGVINISNADLAVDHVSLTNTNGRFKTYTIWADSAETLQLGTFTVADGLNGTDGTDGESIVATTVTDNLNGTHTVEFFTDLAKTQKVGEVILNDGVDGINGTNGVDGTNGLSVHHVSLTATNGLVKTYTTWGDAGETINMGTFDVTDGTNGTNGVSPTVTVLTQAAYNALSPSYDVNTFYVING